VSKQLTGVTRMDSQSRQASVVDLLGSGLIGSSEGGRFVWSCDGGNRPLGLEVTWTWTFFSKFDFCLNVSRDDFNQSVPCGKQL